MHVLIVQSNDALGVMWKRHLQRLGARVSLAQCGSKAVDLLNFHAFDVIVLDLVLMEGSALTVSDFANFRQPEANVVFVTDTTFFSDGSIFAHSSNARAYVQKGVAPRDLAAIVAHFGQAISRADAALSSPVPG